MTGQGAAFIIVAADKAFSPLGKPAADHALHFALTMLREGPMIDAHRVTLAAEDDFDGWRDAARDLAEAGVPPEAVVWLRRRRRRRPVLGRSASSRRARASRFHVPSSTSPRAPSAIPIPSASLCSTPCFGSCGRTAQRWRTAPIPCSHRLERLAKEVRRDVHKMHAFVRFREVEQTDGSTRFVAFFEPDHHIVRHTAGFFVRRFTNMRWSILTPGAFDPLGRRDADRRARRDPRGGARRRSARSDVEDLLRVHLQSGAAQGRRDAQGDAQEILAQHARDLARSAA